MQPAGCCPASDPCAREVAHKPVTAAELRAVGSPADTTGLRDAVKLANGLLMPTIGLGTYKMKGEVATTAVLAALRAGYRLVDTAAVYGGAKDVGQALAASGVPREHYFLQTKQWRAGHGYERTKAQFEEHLKDLRTDYVDALLIHWPGPHSLPDGSLSPPDWTPEMRDTGTWRALEELYDQGKARSIGVCNYSARQLQTLLLSCRIRPMVNQIEYHPFLIQTDMQDLCRKEGIVVQAFASLGGTDGGPSQQQDLLTAAPVLAAAQAHGATAGQVLLRWALQKGCTVLPKSTKEARILENAGCASLVLSSAEMAAIGALDCGRRLTWKGLDPDTIA